MKGDNGLWQGFILLVWMKGLGGLFKTGSMMKEAINTIVQEMENRVGDIIVIFAGYPGRMEAFFERNPGLRSRVPFSISFDDYSSRKH